MIAVDKILDGIDMVVGMGGITLSGDVTVVRAGVEFGYRCAESVKWWKKIVRVINCWPREDFR